MGLFDSLKNVSQNIRSMGGNRTETFTFTALPSSVADLQSLPEANLDSPFKTAALTMLALTGFETDPENAFAMLDWLKGPVDLSVYEKQFITERLRGKYYKVFSFFAGATPENGYKPSLPYTISVSDNPYSYNEEVWATLYLTSGGSDNPRPIKMRKKPSTGQWFLVEVQCLADIRIPVSEDPWA